MIRRTGMNQIPVTTALSFMEREGLCVWRSKALCFWTENWKTGIQGAIFWGTVHIQLVLFINSAFWHKRGLYENRNDHMLARRITCVQILLTAGKRRALFNGMFELVLLFFLQLFCCVLQLNIVGSDCLKAVQIMSLVVCHFTLTFWVIAAC